MKDEYFDSIESITLLPNAYKRYGYIMLVLAIPFSLTIAYWSKSYSSMEEPLAFWRVWGLVIIHFFLAIGLSLVVFSKEKLEDEMIQAIRCSSFVYGVYIFVVACLAFPVLSNLDNILRGDPIFVRDFGGQIAALNLLLLSILMIFRIRLYLERKRA